MTTVTCARTANLTNVAAALSNVGIAVPTSSAAALLNA
jgi:hypothetical protein